MASDLISRAAVFDAYLNADPEATFTEILDSVPAVDAAPVVHARWIDYKDEHQCSACKETTIVDFYVWKHVRFDFCPNCGAIMDGGDSDEQANP